MQGRIFALTGIQSGGKSTMALDIVSALKKQHVNAWFALDIARTTTLPRHALGGTVTQEAICHRMCVALLETAAKHDVVITDRSPFDPVGYNIATGAPMGDPGTERIYRMALDFVLEYFSGIYVVEQGFEIHLDGDRDDDPVFYENSVKGFAQTFDRVSEHLNGTDVRLVSVTNLKEPGVRQFITREIFGSMGLKYE